MESMEFKKISFDYYNDAPSYIKLIIDMIPEKMMSNEKKMIIRDLYNFYMNQYSPEKIEQIVQISKLFRDKMELAVFGDMQSLAVFVESVKLVYFDRLIINASSRSEIFDELFNHIKVTSGFYDECIDNVYNNVKGFRNR